MRFSVDSNKSDVLKYGFLQGGGQFDDRQDNQSHLLLFPETITHAVAGTCNFKK
jgi:hypothetical protein